MGSTEGSGVQEPTSRHCPQCTQEVPAAAKVCTQCGSKLNWARYLGISQATLALVLSLLALGASFWDGYRGWVSEVEDWFSGTNLDLHAYGGAITENSITVVVESRRSYPISIFDISCNLTLLVDQNAYLADQLTLRSEGGGALDNEVAWVGWDVVGRFITDYDIGEPIVIEPFGNGVVTGKIEYIGIPDVFGDPISVVEEKQAPPVGTCWVHGASARHGAQAGGVVFYQPDLISVDALGLISSVEAGDTKKNALLQSLSERINTIREQGRYKTSKKAP